MAGGDHPYQPPAWDDEAARTLLNYLSMRTEETGPEVERLRAIAAEHGLTVQPGVYLPRPSAPAMAREKKPAEPM